MGAPSRYRRHTHADSIPYSTVGNLCREVTELTWHHNITYVARLMSKPALLNFTLQHHRTHEGASVHWTTYQNITYSYVTLVGYTAYAVTINTDGWSHHNITLWFLSVPKVIIMSPYALQIIL